MHRCSLLLQVSHAAWSVCLCVGHTAELCRNGWTDRDAVWGLVHLCPRNHTLDWVKIPTERDTYDEEWGRVPANCNAWVHCALFSCRRGRMDESIRRRESDKTAMRPFANLLWTFVLIGQYNCCAVVRRFWPTTLWSLTRCGDGWHSRRTVLCSSATWSHVTPATTPAERTTASAPTRAPSNSSSTVSESMIVPPATK